jgi:predicted aspartyl protease
VKQRVQVQISNENHYVGVIEMTNTKATINISSNPIQVILGIGDDARVDVLDDGFYDLYILLNSILNNKVNLTIKSIYEEIPEGEGSVKTSAETESNETIGEEIGGETEEERNLTWLWIVIGALVIGVVFFIAINRVKKKNKKRKRKKLFY